MKNRLRQVSRTTVKAKTSTVKYVAGGLALAFFGGIITFVYLNTGKLNYAKAADNLSYWYYNFGSQTGKHTEGTSTTFLPTPPSGTSRVTTPQGKGGTFELMQPGVPGFGSGSALKVSASSDNNPSKFSIVDYQAGKTFYLKYTIRWENGNNGKWFFVIGDGSSFSDNSGEVQASQAFTAFRFEYKNNDNRDMAYQKAGNWTSLPGAFTDIGQEETYTFEIYGNNSSNSISYAYNSSCAIKNLQKNQFDVYLNGVPVAIDLQKSNLADNANIDSYMFYAMNSAQNRAIFYLDDLVYSNSIPQTTLQPFNQPTDLLFSNVSEKGMEVNFTGTSANTSGYVVLRKAGSPATSTPVDFTNYAVGAVVGDARVAYIGANTTFVEEDLKSGTEYFYTIYAFNGIGSCINYRNDSPLAASQFTHFTEDEASYKSAIEVGEWVEGKNWEYEYLPGKFKRATKYPTRKNKSILILNKHSIQSSGIVAENLNIQKGGALTVSGDITIFDGPSDIDVVNEGIIKVSGKFSVIGKMNHKAGSIVELTGGVEQSLPAGTYTNLKMSNKGSKKLSGDITVMESLELSSTSVLTNGYSINLAPEAKFSGETKTGYVNGKIKTTRNIDGSREDLGDFGLVIDATENKENLGSVAFIRTTGAPIVVGSASSISRSWSIEPQFQPKKEVKLTMVWGEQDEENPFELTRMQVWKSPDHGKNWIKVGAIQVATNRKITVNTSSFSDWTASDEYNSLPVKFRSFKGVENINGSMTLKWSTSEELNNEGFEVQKSLDSKEFVKIGFVQGVGNSNDINSYEFTDMDFTAKSYYRLKQVDFNGVFDFSTMIFADKKINGAVQKSFSLYPNPVIDQATISTSLKEVGKIDVAIYSSKGKEVFRFSGTIDDVNDEFARQLGGWEADIYIVNISANGKQEKLKMIKK